MPISLSCNYRLEAPAFPARSLPLTRLTLVAFRGPWRLGVQKREFDAAASSYLDQPTIFPHLLPLHLEIAPISRFIASVSLCVCLSLTEKPFLQTKDCPTLGTNQPSTTSMVPASLFGLLQDTQESIMSQPCCPCTVTIWKGRQRSMTTQLRHRGHIPLSAKNSCLY